MGQTPTSKKRPSLSRTFLIYISIGNSLVIGIADFAWIARDYARGKREMERVRQEYVKEQHEKVRKQTAEALDYVLFKKSQALSLRPTGGRPAFHTPQF